MAKGAAWFLAGLGGLVALAGCGTNGPALGKVRGVVAYRGKPLAGATVTFLPVDSAAPSRPGIGVTNEQGRYELGTFGPADGALVGEHVVTIVAREVYRGTPPPGAGAAWLEEAEARATPSIPLQYFNQRTTPLKATVKQGHNTANFSLSDSPR